MEYLEALHGVTLIKMIYVSHMSIEVTLINDYAVSKVLAAKVNYCMTTALKLGQLFYLCFYPGLVVA